jgi:type I restriction enzyme, S subunit
LSSQKTKQGYKLVPSLFGKYEEIPEEWEIKKLEDIAKIKGRIGWRGYTKKDFVDEGEGAISLGGKNIKNSKLDLTKRTYITFEKYEESPEIQVDVNDILIQKTGSIGGVALIGKDIGKATINPNVSIIKKILCDPVFLSYFLTNSHITKQINRFKTFTSIPLLTQEQINSLIIFSPPKPEQQKIVLILSNIDSLIDSYDKIIKSAMKLKQGLVQQLFSKGIGHKKFKKAEWLFGDEIEIPEEWEVKKIGEHAHVTLLAGFEWTEHITLEDEGDVGVIRAQNVKRGRFLEMNIKFISKQVSNSLPRSKLHGNEILFVWIGEVGNVCLSPQGNWHLGKNVAKITPLDGIDREFLCYFLQSGLGMKNVTSESKANVQPSINMATIRKFCILLAPFKEQRKIVGIISQMDSKINGVESKKNNLEQLKKGLMQSLLIGQIRVKV